MSYDKLNLQSSQIADYYRCPRMWYYKYKLNKVTAGNSHAIDRGSAFHYMMEHHYKDGEDVDGMISFIKHGYPELSEEAILEGYMMFTSYLNHYQDKDEYEFHVIDDKPAIELEFKIELSPTINFFGKFDAIMVRNSKLYAWDYKTTGSYLSGNFFDKYELAYQTFVYSWAAKEIFGDKMSGFVIDAISCPKSKNINFARRFFPFLIVVDEFLEELYETTQYIEANLDNEEAFSHNYTSCAFQFGRKCTFAPVCMAPKERRQDILESGLYSDNKPIYDFE